MGLSTKHPNQQTIILNNFTEGLNATTVPEMIGDNQLCDAVNVGLDAATGSLCTLCGTETLYRTPDDLKIRSMLYDKINNHFFFVSGKELYRTTFVRHIHVGTLSGNHIPIYTEWEDGILIASGGKMQYWNGKALSPIDKSPDVCEGVYVRAARVLVYHENEIRYSAVGDEEDWTEDNNVDSASKFIEAGYKDGGSIVGMVNLSSDILILKSNDRVYRLSGEYPNWAIREVGRNIDCLGRNCYCAVTNSVLVLGNNKVQMINTTQEYGDMKADNVAQNVVNLFCQLSMQPLPRIIFVPTLNQVWILGTIGMVTVYDLNFNCFYQRRFNADIVDVVSVGDTVYIIKENCISKLVPYMFVDEDKPLLWKFWAKRKVSYYDYLLKRVQISYVPLLEEGEQGAAEVSVGMVVLRPSPAPLSPLVYENDEEVYENERLVYPIQNQMENIRQVYRSRYLDVKGKGTGSGVIFDKIMFDIAEV